MAGAYCRYCDHRCFVDRIIPDTGREIHLATCPGGKAHDRRVSGYDADTAVNPSIIQNEVYAVAAGQLESWTAQALIDRDRTIAILRRQIEVKGSANA